jgi:PmbA protein
MSRELLEIAHRAVQTARKRGAASARVTVYRQRESIVEWRDAKLDRVRESTQMGLSIGLYVDGRWSINSTSDLRRQGLEAFVGDAVATTRVLQPDPHRKLPDPKRYGGRHTGDLRILDAEGSAAMTAAERRRVGAALHAGVRGAPGAERVVTDMSSCTDARTESVLVTTNGMEGARESTMFNIFAMASVKDVGNRKPSGYWWAGARRRSDLPTPDSVGREATRRALACLGEKPEKSGRYACIIENAVAERLLNNLIEALQGQPIQQRKSFLGGKIGQPIASAVLSITDDPLRPAGIGSRAYDGEGMAARSRTIIDKGVLRSYYLDTYYGSKLGAEPTVADATNLTFALGTRDLAALQVKMDEGILVTGFSGGNCNTASGDFSIGVRGQWIEGGKPLRPIAEMNLAGNHLELWRQLKEVGNDPYRYSSAMCPSLRFDPVQFSGV